MFQNCWTLQLTEGKVFHQFIYEFSKVHLPDRITYDGNRYNLTEAYNEFWQTLYNLPEYTLGNKIKLINNNLGHDKLLAIVRVLKRGWKDERYFPKRLAKPLLEACLFNRESENEVDFKPTMFYKYIDPIDLEIIENAGDFVDVESLKVFEKYCPGTRVSLGDKVKSACIEVLHKIMFRDIKNIHEIWTLELVGLLDFKEFTFAIKKQPTISAVLEDDVITTSPHRLWGTFFYKWSDQIREFYFKSLKNLEFKTCNFCYQSNVSAKHILSNCGSTSHFRMTKERHDCALNVVVYKLKEALDHSPYFSLSKHWKMKVMSQNYRTPWPQELEMLNSLNKFPHIVVWTTYPRKKALVIEITVSWDCWIDGSLYYSKTAKYRSFMDVLKHHGFETDFQDIKMGSRGILSPDLYRVLDKICGMSHSEISKTMEKISKKSIELAYNFCYAGW